MSHSVPLRRDAKWATATIRERAKDSGKVFLTAHARSRMAERDLTLRDVLDILRKGDVIDAPRQNDRGGWEGLIEKRMPGGRDAAVATVIPDGDELIVKTVEWKDIR